MKGFIKQFVLLFGIVLITYLLLFSKNPVSNYFQSSFSGLFSLIFPKEEKTIFFEIQLENNSQLEIKGIFDVDIHGTIKEFNIEKISIQKESKNISMASLKCVDSCFLKKYEETSEFSGKLSVLNLDDIKFSGLENSNVKLQMEKTKEIKIFPTSKSLEICLSNAKITISYGTHKVEQTIYSDCVYLDGISKVIFNITLDKSIISGYVSSFKSTFLNI